MGGEESPTANPETVFFAPVATPLPPVTALPPTLTHPHRLPLPCLTYALGRWRDAVSKSTPAALQKGMQDLASGLCTSFLSGDSIGEILQVF